MTHSPLVLPAIAIATWAAPAASQAVPGQLFVVINNTMKDHQCAAKLPGQAWSGWFRINKGANWTLQQSAATLKFQCALPVRQKNYTLKRGKRYNLLRLDDGAVAVVEISTAPPPAPDQ